MRLVIRAQSASAVLIAAVVGLSGCETARSLRSTPDVPTASLIAAHATQSNAEVFVSDSLHNVVNGYDQATGTLLIHLTGFDIPQGLASDGHGNIYVADSGNQRVLVFAPRQTKPFRTLDDLGWSPTGVAVSDAGEVAVTNNVAVQGPGGYGYYPGSVTFFKKDEKRIYRWLDGAQFAYPYFCAYDHAGNLYLDAVSLAAKTTVGEIVGGARGKMFEPVEMSGVHFPGGVQVDGSNELLVLDQYRSTIHRYSLDAGHSDGTVQLAGAGDPVSFALTSDDAEFYAADARQAAIEQYAYPAGGNPTQEIPVGGMPTGIAVTPRATP